MRLKRRVVVRYIGLLGAVVLSGMLLLHTSQEVQRKEAQLNGLKRALNRERQNISVLEAEWAHLNSPYRLEKLALDYLDMVPPESKQIMPDAGLLPDEEVVSGEDLPDAPKTQAGQDVSQDGAQGGVIAQPVSTGAPLQPKRKPEQASAAKAVVKAAPVAAPVVTPTPAPVQAQKAEGGMNDLLKRMEVSQ